MVNVLAVKTLFCPFMDEQLAFPDAGSRILFLNAVYDPFLDNFEKTEMVIVQHDVVLAQDLERRGFEVLPVLPEETPDACYELVLLCAPKNRDEARYFLAEGFGYMKDGGLMVCAAANDAGGKVLPKDLSVIAGQSPASFSKNKARAVWTHKNTRLLNGAVAEEWKGRGSLQKCSAHGLLSRPGIFGWDKIDKGSEILLQYLPDDLKGACADFGCGYGFLSHYMAQHFPDIVTLYCIDSDARAVMAARINLDDVEGDNTDIVFIQDDLTAPQSLLQNLDFVVMNPPFHQGKRQDPSIGFSFIDTAAKFLKEKGRLYMVANKHLPYENHLYKRFRDVKCAFEGDGFKVFCAIK